MDLVSRVVVWYSVGVVGPGEDLVYIGNWSLCCVYLHLDEMTSVFVVLCGAGP